MVSFVEDLHFDVLRILEEPISAGKALRILLIKTLKTYV